MSKKQRGQKAKGIKQQKKQTQQKHQKVAPGNVPVVR